MKMIEYTHTIDLDEVAIYKPPHLCLAGPRRAVCSASDSRTRGLEFDSHILLFLLLLVVSN